MYLPFATAVVDVPERFVLRVYGAHVRAVEQAGVRKPKQTQRGHAICRDALRTPRSKTLSRLQQSINTVDCLELLLIGRHNGNVLDDQNQNCGGVVQLYTEPWPVAFPSSLPTAR